MESLEVVPAWHQDTHRHQHESCLPVAPGTDRQLMPRDMPRPAMMRVGATMQALSPCLCSNGCTRMREPQPRSSSRLAAGLPAARRSAFSSLDCTVSMHSGPGLGLLVLHLHCLAVCIKQHIACSVCTHFICCHSCQLPSTKRC